MSAHVLQSTSCTGNRRDLQRSYRSLKCCLYTWVLFMYRYSLTAPHTWRCEVGRLDCLGEAGSLLAGLHAQDLLHFRTTIKQLALVRLGGKGLLKVRPRVVIASMFLPHLGLRVFETRECPIVRQDSKPGSDLHQSHHPQMTF